MVRNKRISHVICLILSFCMIVTAVFCLPFTKASASTEPEVQLYYAQRNDPGEAAYGGYTGVIAVKNLAYQKNVTVHYTTDGNTWQDIPTKFLKSDPNYSQYDVWDFGLLAPSSSLTFAIKYEVNGQTYWDNNNGKNYTVSPTAPIVFGKSVLKTAQISEGCPLAIYLNNLGNPKNVLVNYTTNNWNSSTSVTASYEKSLPGNVEQWKVPNSIPHGSDVKYSVSYTVNNITYIDNNFGDYYTNY